MVTGEASDVRWRRCLIATIFYLLHAKHDAAEFPRTVRLQYCQKMLSVCNASLLWRNGFHLKGANVLTFSLVNLTEKFDWVWAQTMFTTSFALLYIRNSAR